MIAINAMSLIHPLKESTFVWFYQFGKSKERQGECL